MIFLNSSAGSVSCRYEGAKKAFAIQVLLNFHSFSCRSRQHRIDHQNLVHRSITATVLLHLLCLVLWGGPYAFAAFAAAVLLLGVYEITGLLKVKRVP